MEENNKINLDSRKSTQYELPSLEDLIDWESEGGCKAVDGCWVKPDGICEHGSQSWLLILGLI